MPGPAGPSPKLLGRVAAVILAAGFAGVIWWSMSSAPAPTPATPGTDFTDAPDITQLETGEAIVLTMADRDNPGRVAGVIEADRLDPGSDGQRLLANPRAWLYPEGGRVIRVLADRAVLVMPADQSPESGTLEGSVRVLVYESDTPPGTPPPDDAEPVLTASFEEPVRFERRYMRLSSPGPFRIDTDRVRFRGADLSLMLNEVRRRLERLDVQAGGTIEFDLAQAGAGTATPPTSEEPSVPSPDTPADNAAAAAGAEPAPPSEPSSEPGPPKIDLYRTVLSDTVVAAIGTTRVDADRLELFTRLTDNALPAESIARVAFRSRGAPATTPTPEREPPALSDDQASPPHEPATVTAADAGADANDPAPATPDTGTLVLTWTGPLAVRPLDSESPPEQLAADDAALSLHAEAAPGVRITDAERGIDAEAGAVRYFATRALLDLEPASDAPVRIDMADAGVGRFAGVRADLLRGVIDLAGPGSARSRTEAAIDWSDTARLTLAVAEDGALTDRLRSGDFSGSVAATQDGARIDADTLTTAFEPDAAGRAALRSAVITAGSLTAEPGPGGLPRSLAADTITAAFAGDAGDPAPTAVEAAGRVDARADGATLRADAATALLDRDALGAVRVRTADASGSVEYTDLDDTRATGDRLEVDALAETVRISGDGASVAQGDSTVTGPVIDLDARRRRMAVTGAGRFDHTLRDADANPAGRVLARWTDSMRFDDAMGRLHAEGDVSVVSTPDALTRDTMRARRVEVEITPQPVRDTIGGLGPAKRELQVARLYGDSDADDARPATVETRRYDPANPERLAGQLYLESDQIVADAASSTLRVPGPGTLLVLDRRGEQPGADPSDPTPIGGAAGPGLTRFTWAGSFELDRTTGGSVMEDEVLVLHKTLGGDQAGQVAELATDRLTARFVEPTDGSAAFALDAAEAQGSVVFSASGRQLFADGALYEAGSDVIHALALPGRLVELREPGRTAPLSARAMVWDLRRDRIEINRPSPVTLPN
jgi:lipopolysaccharide export system protein LptA